MMVGAQSHRRFGGMPPYDSTADEYIPAGYAEIFRVTESYATSTHAFAFADRTRLMLSPRASRLIS